MDPLRRALLGVIWIYPLSAVGFLFALRINETAVLCLSVLVYLLAGLLLWQLLRAADSGRFWISASLAALFIHCASLALHVGRKPGVGNFWEAVCLASPVAGAAFMAFGIAAPLQVRGRSTLSWLLRVSGLCMLACLAAGWYLLTDLDTVFRALLFAALLQFGLIRLSASLLRQPVGEEVGTGFSSS